MFDYLKLGPDYSAKRPYKSPSTLSRDRTRINSFISDQESFLQVKVQNNEIDTHFEKGTDSDNAPEEHNKSQEVDQIVEDDMETHSECTPANKDDTREEPCTEQEDDGVENKPMTEKSNQCGTQDSNVTCDTEKTNAHDDTVKAMVMSEVDIVHDTENKMEDPQAVYRKNIRNNQRNLNFGKIVHDTRNEGSVVYGMTDDLIILVDERNCKYTTWAKHDRGKKCDEILELLNKWPPANSKRCKYGVDTLHTLLPDIVQSEQKPK